MVNDRRRARRDFPLNLRHHGLTLKQRTSATTNRQVCAFLWAFELTAKPESLKKITTSFAKLTLLRHANTLMKREFKNPTFIRRVRTLDTISDEELYSEHRITSRANAMRLLDAFGLAVVLVANKIDVDYNVTRKEFKFAAKHNLPFFFVSAADGTNVVKVFESAILEVKRFKESGGDVLSDMLSLLGEPGGQVDAKLTTRTDKEREKDRERGLKCHFCTIDKTFC